MVAIDRQLSDQQAGDWIGRTTGADTTRGRARIDSARRETVIADDFPILVYHHDASKILALIGARECPEPVIKRGLAAFEAREIMQIGQRLDGRKRHDDSGRGYVSAETLKCFRGQRLHRTVDGREEIGIGIA